MTTKGTLPLLSLREIVLFPHMIVPLFAGREETLAAIDASYEDENGFDKKILCACQIDPDVEQIRVENLYSVGVEATILQRLKLPDGTVKLLLEGLNRVALRDVDLMGEINTASFVPLSEANDGLEGASETIQSVNDLLAVEHKLERRRAASISAKQLRESRSIEPMKLDSEALEALLKGFGKGETRTARWRATRAEGEAVESVHPDRKDIDIENSIVVPNPDRQSQAPVSHSGQVAQSEIQTWQFPVIPEEYLNPLLETDAAKDPARWVDLLVPHLGWPVSVQQSFLEDTNVARRLDRMHRMAQRGFHPAEPASAVDLDLETREVFISHADADKHRIRPFVERVLEEGYRVFIDRPDELGLEAHPRVSGLKSGPFRAQLGQALKRAACVLTFWSEEAVQAERTELHEEAAAGKAVGKLVQVSIDTRDEILPRLPLGFSEWHLLDVSEDSAGFARDERPDLDMFIKEIRDIIDVDPVSGAPLQTWEQQSKSVKIAVVGDILRTIERPPPVAPEAPTSTLNQLRDRLIAELRKVVNRLKLCQHHVEEDIRDVAQEIIDAFDEPLEEINTVVAPSMGENLLLFEQVLSETDIRREIADHLMFSIPLAARAYREFIDLWADWKDQLSDPAMLSVTPENADETRAAADLVTEFARNAHHIVDEGVPAVLDAMRRLIKTNYSVSRFNEYRYLNAIGEGLRACWDAGRAYITENWACIEASLQKGDPPILGAFNEFILEMGEALEQLASANPDLFGWLHVRLGYLRRLRAGKITALV